MIDLTALIDGFVGKFMHWDSRLAGIYLCATVLLCFAIWLYRGRPAPFVQWLFPKAVYRHASNLVDLKVFATNVILQVAGVFAAIAFTPVMAEAVSSQLHVWFAESGHVEITWATRAFATLVIILAADFCTYWNHRLHHETGVLWPFHALHHSAEVLTPLTVFRKHPLYDVIRAVIRGFVIGTVQGVLLFVFIGKVDLLTIGTVNAGYFFFNILGSNLRHTHIWLSYGPVMEHIFISPAQHQIHHSSDVKHHNKNYGEVFAIWDWMFGSLYIPKSYEKLEFGIADAHGNKLEQPHPTLRAALFHPFVESWQTLRGKPETEDQHYPAE